MSYINFLRHTFVGDASDNTPEGSLIRTGGKHASKTITLNANNTTASVNVFQVTGVVEVLQLHAEIKTATTLTNCTSIYFNLYDGTNTVAITKSTGAAISGYNAGGFIIRDSDSSVALSTINNDQCRIKEAPTGTKVHTPFLTIQKTATNTYIRFTYTTTDAPINATLEVHCVWADIDNGTLTAV